MSETLLSGDRWTSSFLQRFDLLTLVPLADEEDVDVDVEDLSRLLALESPHKLVPPCVEGMFRNVMPWRGGPSAKLRGTPSHCKSISSGTAGRRENGPQPFKVPHRKLDVFVEILAGRRKLLRGGQLKVPQLVLHAVVELLRVLLPFQVELAADGGVLKFPGTINRLDKLLVRLVGTSTISKSEGWSLLLPLRWRSNC